MIDGINGKARGKDSKLVRAFDLAYYVRTQVKKRSGDRQIPVIPFSAATYESRRDSPLDLVLAKID